MTLTEWTLAGLVAMLIVYAAFVVALLLAGRRGDARAVAGFIPDCIVLLRGLLADPGVSGWRRATIFFVIAYLAMPIDLVPDIIPVAGQLDDAIVVALALRIVVRGAGPAGLEAHWPGPDRSLTIVSRLAFGNRVGRV